MAVPYNRKQLIERIKKHVSDGFPNDDFAPSTNEIMLYLDQAIAFAIVGKAYENAKIEGVLAVPEAFHVTYNLGIMSQDDTTNEWFATLPQPPLSLPLGYSISDVYFATPSMGRSESAFPTKVKTVGYDRYLPQPSGTSYRVENSIIWVKSSNGNPLSGATLYVQMPVNRSPDLTTPMNMPDDVIMSVFDTVVKELMQRYQVPQDIIRDELPAGNKSS